MARITIADLKFPHVVSSLPPEIATEIRDLILTPPEQTLMTFCQLSSSSVLHRWKGNDSSRYSQLIN
ncbi:hypothetical protein HPB49_001392 [Dermacentor silvarum]|uniref:Uncharacterized protein n=1 Tax=Dermacentor silvarum TaxID=543639 RepID=A0ACB8CNL8_DERSI|nr:hypothetical protein HPB49_001392 [Dermacentor silvarum]